MQLEDVEERQQLNKGRKPLKFSVKEKIVAIMKHRLDTCPHIELKVQKEKSCSRQEATYQRLVDSAFKEQIGVNLEAYVDDMVSGGILKKKPRLSWTCPHQELLSRCSLLVETGASNHFLSKSAERSLPFLDTLKKCTNKKDFRWTEAAEATFLEMKKLVSELPTLTTLKKGKTLMMYLATTDEAVSAVLLTETDGRQIPIHYAIEGWVLPGSSDHGHH
ncbi:hypothetical protein Tco_1165080 [Tanacetum coccineum]